MINIYDYKQVDKYTVLKYYNDVLKSTEDYVYINGFIGAYPSDNIPKLKN